MAAGMFTSCSEKGAKRVEVEAGQTVDLIGKNELWVCTLSDILKQATFILL